MKKLKVLFVALMALVTTTAWAQKPIPKFSPVATDGNTVQYIYNVEADAFFAGGNAWGTQGTLASSGYQFKVKLNADGTYALIDYPTNKNNWLTVFIDGGGEVYVDGGNSFSWKVTSTGAGTDTYYIAPTDREGKLGNKADRGTKIDVVTDNSKTEWAFVSEADYTQYIKDMIVYTDAMSKAEGVCKNYTSMLTTEGQTAFKSYADAYLAKTSEDCIGLIKKFKELFKQYPADGADATTFVINPKFEGNINGWTDTYTKGNHGYQSNKPYTNGDVTINQFMECWVSSGGLEDAKLYQAIEGLPEGEYTMSADIIAVRQSTPNKSEQKGVFIFAESNVLFQSDDCSTGNEKPENFSFNFKMTGDKLDLGLMTKETNCNWVAFDNVTLTYNGPLKSNIYQDALVEALKSYTDRSSEYAQTAAKEAYAAALNEAKTASTTDGESNEFYQAATTKLTDADNALTASAKAYAKLKATYEPLEDKTGFESAVATAKAAYEEKLLDVDGINDCIETFKNSVAEINRAQFIANAKTPYTGAEVAEGDFYLYNVESGKFLNGANSWGTQASLCDAGQYVTLAAGTGTYSIDSHILNKTNEHYLTDGAFMDGVICQFTFTNIGSNFYTISFGGGEKFYGNDDSSVLATLTTESAGCYWQLVTREEMLKAAAANGTSAKPFEISSIILDNNFGRNNTLQSNWNGLDWNGLGKKGGNNDNICVEVFQKTFNSYQTLTGMPNGIYRMTAQGFYRQDGSDDEHLPVFYANGEEKTFPLLTGAENSMAAASTSFSEGKYTIEPIEFVVYNGTITLGAKLDVNTSLWSIWDNFRLYYCGEGEDIDATIAESGLSTFSSKYAVTIPEGVKAYKATSATDAYVHMEEITGQIPAQTGVVLVGTPSQTYTFGYYGENLDAITDNKLVAATNAIQLDPTSGDNTNYVLVGGEFHPFTGKATLAAGKAYLSLPTAVSAKSLFLDFGTADGIESISTKTANEGLFNLAGQAVGNDFKGIVIKNGKKMLNK